MVMESLADDCGLVRTGRGDLRTRGSARHKPAATSLGMDHRRLRHVPGMCKLERMFFDSVDVRAAINSSST